MKKIATQTALIIVAIFSTILSSISVSSQCIHFNKVISGATSTHCLGIKTDGTLWSWGSNSNGELGNNSLVSSSVPIQVGTTNTWNEIATGNHFSLAIDTDGKLWGWGIDNLGQLGDNQPLGVDHNVLNPEHIQSADSIWKTIAANASHTIGITADGKLWGWGYQLFYNSGGSTPNVPTQIGSDTDWSAVSIGTLHFIVIKKDSTLWAWGRNGEGEAGDSTTKENIYTPPVEIDSNHVWVYVSAGANHTLALKNDGTLWAWGDNENGKLGDGSTSIAIYKPEQIGMQKWLTVSAGVDHSLGIDSNGRRWAWGDNGLGEFGNDSSTNNDTYSPKLIDSSNNWMNVVAARDFSLNLSEDGSAWSSGDNDFEELGDGTNTRRFTLVKVGSPAVYPALATTGKSDKEYQRGFTYYTSNCSSLITEIFKAGSNPIQNITTAKVWIDDTVNNDGEGKPYVQRHYEVHPANNDTTATGTVLLYFKQDEFTAYNSSANVINGTYPMLPVDSTDGSHTNNLRIERILATSSDKSGTLNSYKGTSILIPPTSVQWLNGRWQVTLSITGFGGFFATTGSTILPVTWLNVNGFINDQNQAQISWKVNEFNVMNYVVEKSSDGISFNSIATVTSKGTGVNSYQYNDNLKLTGSLFYRIKQTDKDGKLNYSSVVSVNNISTSLALTLAPNPVTDQLYVNGLQQNKVYDFLITNMQGRLIMKNQITSTQNHLLVTNFERGVYLIKVITDDAAITLKFIKQ